MLHASNTFVPYNYPLKEAEVVFLGVPFAHTSISKPALYGPLMVRESLKLVEGFVNGRNIFDLKFCDLGDVEVVPGSFELTAKRIKETISEIKEESKAFPIFIGGDHSITLPIVEALKPKTIVHLNAHADMLPDFLGNKYTHQTWAYHASKLAKIIQLGVCAVNKEEIKNMNVMKEIPSKMERPIHLTIDIDVLKNVVTGYPEGRMKLEELLKIIEKIKPDSMDIVEIADNKLPSNTGFAAAQIILNVLSRL